MQKQNTYKRISLALFAVSILLAAVSLRVAELRIGPYGLIQSLPPMFYISLILLTVSFLIMVRYDANNKVYLFIYLIALILLLYLLPAIIEKTARFPPAYLVNGSTEYVLKYGHINPPTSTYQQWPGPVLLGASIVQVTKVSSYTVLIAFPIVYELISLSLLWSILSRVSRSQKLVWFGLWLYFVAGWINRGYFSAQAYGYLIFLMIAFIIVSAASKKGEIQPSTSWVTPIILIILLFALSTSHVLSLIVAIVGLIISYIIFRIFKMRGTRSFVYIASSFVITAIVWAFINAGGSFFKDVLQGASGIHELFNFGAIYKSTVEVPFSAGSEHTRIMLLRAAYTGAFCTLALLGLLYSLIKKKTHINTIVMLGLLVGACSIIVLAGNYGGEIVYRAFEYSLVFLAFFAARGLMSRALSILLIIFILASPVLFVATAYANEKSDYISPAELEGVNFYLEQSPESSEMHSLVPRIWRMNVEKDRWKPLDLTSLPTCGNVSQNNQMECYFLVGQRDLETSEFLWGLNINAASLREAVESSCRAKVYSSDGFDLYSN